MERAYVGADCVSMLFLTASKYIGLTDVIELSKRGVGEVNDF